MSGREPCYQYLPDVLHVEKVLKTTPSPPAVWSDKNHQSQFLFHFQDGSFLLKSAWNSHLAAALTFIPTRTVLSNIGYAWANKHCRILNTQTFRLNQPAHAKSRLWPLLLPTVYAGKLGRFRPRNWGGFPLPSSIYHRWKLGFSCVV